MLQVLSRDPVQGRDLSRVSLLRLDRLDSIAPGNKIFKLRPVLEQAGERGIRTLVSFGGAWSNHLHALAGMGREHGYRTVGIVRGERPPRLSATLEEASDWGMQLHFVSRGEYRCRNEARYRRQLEARYAPCLIVPEGGATAAGVRGSMEIARLLPASSRPLTVLVAVGTGTTLAGLAAGLGPRDRVLGIAALKGGLDLEHRVQGLLSEAGVQPRAQWEILHDFHCGGFARASTELQDFLLAFERVQGVPLEPVYTGKLMLAVSRLLGRNAFTPGEQVVAIHTGGLQGRRGYPWLAG